MEICVKQLGIEVRGVRLTDPTISSDKMVEQIKKLVTKHRILIFRDQGEVSGDKHAEISRWFGIIGGTLSKDDPLYSHPKCPYPDVYRISNDPEEGCINVGRSGWHIDGSYLHEPFGYALYHIIAVPKTGPTEFIGFKELINSISEETRARWERLWMVADKGENLAQPLIYSHPVTGESVMCIHLGMTKAFIWDKDTPNEEKTNSDETNELLKEIRSEIEKDERRLIYSHEWKDGDFLISDNLAVGHYASNSSARARSEIGLRILHRTTVKGLSRPTKMILK